MASTVISAFNEFLKDKVNLDTDQTSQARSSRNWLVDKINNFSDFLPLYKEKNIFFGSFARRTKKRPLDDIDIMITLMAYGCTYEETGNTIYITTPESSIEYKNFRHDNSSHLNSKK